MKSLSLNWFTSDPLDFEYKQLLLLSYLKESHDLFKERKLYPVLTDMISHIKNLEVWDQKREFLKGNLIGIDYEKMTLLYDIPENSKEMKEIDIIVKYSLDELNKVFKFGRKIWSEIESKLRWNIVGIIPEYKSEGYVFIHIENLIKIYRYTLKKVYQDNENFVGINFEFIKEDKILLNNNYENIKLSLIKERKELPNPLTFSIDVPYYPIEESILPIVKRLTTIKINKLDSENII